MWQLLTRSILVLCAALASATATHALTITYSSIQGNLKTSAFARAGANTTGTSDQKTDLATTPSYSNSLDSTVFDQDLAGSTAIASAGSELTLQLLPFSPAQGADAMTIDGIAGSAEQVFGGGRADTAATELSLSFLFEVDEIVQFSTYLFVDFNEHANAWIKLYQPDGSLLIAVDPNPTNLPGVSGQFSVGLSGYLNPGGQYRLEIGTIVGGTCIGSGAAGCFSDSALNFHFDLTTNPLPNVPTPSGALLLFVGMVSLLALRANALRQKPSCD